MLKVAPLPRLRMQPPLMKARLLMPRVLRAQTFLWMIRTRRRTLPMWNMFLWGSMQTSL